MVAATLPVQRSVFCTSLFDRMFVATTLLVYDVLVEGCGMLLRETSLAHESPDESLDESLDGAGPVNAGGRARGSRMPSCGAAPRPCHRSWRRRCFRHAPSIACVACISERLAELLGVHVAA